MLSPPFFFSPPKRQPDLPFPTPYHTKQDVDEIVREVHEELAGQK